MTLFCAEVVKLVDAVDSKSTVRKYMAVRFRPSAPSFHFVMPITPAKLLIVFKCQ